MTHFWPLTFGLIGYWFLAGVLDFIRTPTPPKINDSGLNRRPMPN